MVFNASLITVLLLAGTASRQELGVVVLVAVSSVLFQYSIVASFAILAGALALRCVRLQVAAPAREMSAALLLVAVIGAISLVSSASARPPVFFQKWPPTTHVVLAKAFHDHTSKDDVILVPTWLTGVRILTNRAIVVNMKAFPMYAPEMVEWANRMLDITGVDPRLMAQYLEQGADIWQIYDQGYQARSMVDLLAAATKYGARFILVSTGSRYYFEATRSAIPAVWSENGYALYSVADAVK
ncbi:MAG: hypothetical protein E4H01_10880 [Lysobacterales bacterium]|nr:MAG: hypothetical protein E4H01_10880 [Xanthomonadales bacterium]